MRLYGLKACDTCKKASKALPKVEFIDVRETPQSLTQLTEWYDEFGEKLLNTRSTTWRNLTEDERNEAPIALMLAYPLLMKRPIIEDHGKRTLGWDKAAKAHWGV